MTRISKLTKLSCAILLSSSAMSMEMTKEQQIRNLQQQFSEVDKETLEDLYDATNGNMGQIFDFFRPSQVPITTSVNKKKDQIPVQESPKVNTNSFINHINNPVNSDLPTQLMEINRKISEQKINLINSERECLNTASKKEDIKNCLINTLWEIRADKIEELEEQISHYVGKIQSLTNERKNLASEYDISQKCFDKRMKLFDEFKEYPELRKKWDNRYLEEEKEEISQTAIKKESINDKISKLNKKLSDFKSRLTNGYNQKYINDNINMWNKIGLGKDFVEAIRFVSDKTQDFIEAQVGILKDQTKNIKNYGEGVNSIESQLFSLNSKKENIEYKISAIKEEEQRIEAEKLETKRKAEEERRRIEIEQLEIARKAEAKQFEIKRKAAVEQLQNESITKIINMFETIKVDTKSENRSTIEDQLTKLTDNITTLTWKDESGKNLFHIAAENGSMGTLLIAQLYKKFQVISRNFINQSSNNGSTPLHLAAFSGNRDAIRLLLKCDANVFAATPAGITILEAAAMYLEGCEEESNETKIKNAKEIIDIILKAQYAQDNDEGTSSGQGNNPPENMNILWRTNDIVKKYVENRISYYEAERKRRLEQERVDREHREYVQRVRLEQEALAQKKEKEEKEVKKKLESERIQRERLERERLNRERIGREEQQQNDYEQQHYYRNNSYQQQHNYR